jgi:hypothetical protein
VRFGGAAMFFSPERTLVAGTSTAENLLTNTNIMLLHVTARNSGVRAQRNAAHCAKQHRASSCVLLLVI